jgi:hypothetical protein
VRPAPGSGLDVTPESTQLITYPEAGNTVETDVRGCRTKCLKIADYAASTWSTDVPRRALRRDIPALADTVWFLVFLTLGFPADFHGFCFIKWPGGP